ncbi:DNA adenine methylase [Microbacterium karelineae]|uniref:DNA adenine methylase n=1 Tax=Microbacterium karelineae TaxID=2654283 RepID=UPI0018D44087|nr:Dam family site-specific DNA-(adenine-N6)-methyltransferase [Microbacterium karelineae]
MTDATSTDAQTAIAQVKSKQAETPFLRWAGGKRWLVPEILELVENIRFDDYHEPFLGGGSVFFALKPGGQVRLSDLNMDLITVYRRVRDNPSGVADRLMRYENTSDCYYAARAAKPTTNDDLAARFIYLNHTSYNGIYRVNLKGEYNVPYGNRTNTRIPNRARLKEVSERLQGVELNGRSFEISLGDVKEGDLVFLDPPYTVAHNNNGFVKYNQHLFSFEDQKLLAKSINEISERGANFILTNAAHKSIDELFSPLARKITVARRNVIGGVNARRGRADEYVFTNIGAK